MVLTLLSKDPAHRYPDAAALAADLAATKLGQSIPTRGPRSPLIRRAVRRLRREMRGAVVPGVVILLTFLALWIRGDLGRLVTGMAPGSVSPVLWVDDNPANNGEVIRRLTSHGVEVTTALNTSDALRRYDPAVHQLVIPDIGRYEGPGEEYVGRAGLELLTQLRARSEAVQLVFCSSARAAARNREEALSLGAVEVYDDCGKVLRLIGF